MIDRTHVLPLAAQCRRLGIARGCVYYRPVPVSEADLRLMRRIDEPHLAFPFFGSRRLRPKLREDGLDVGRAHLTTLMRRMGIEADQFQLHTALVHQASAERGRIKACLAWGAPRTSFP